MHALLLMQIVYDRRVPARERLEAFFPPRIREATAIEDKTAAVAGFVLGHLVQKSFAVDGDVVGERAKIIIEKVVTEFGREVGLGVEEQRSEVVLQGACTAALVVDEIRLAVAQHDVARLKVTVEEIVARGAEK